MRWPQVGAGHMALENSAERVRLDVALQPERRRAPAPPVARLAVLVAGAGVVVPAVGVRAVVVRTVVIRRAQDRLVSVDAEVALRARGGGEVDDGRDHDATVRRHRARRPRRTGAAGDRLRAPEQSPRPIRERAPPTHRGHPRRRRPGNSLRRPKGGSPPGSGCNGATSRSRRRTRPMGGATTSGTSSATPSTTASLKCAAPAAKSTAGSRRPNRSLDPRRHERARRLGSNRTRPRVASTVWRRIPRSHPNRASLPWRLGPVRGVRARTTGWSSARPKPRRTPS